MRHPERLRLPGVLGTSHTVVPGERLLGPQEVASYLGLPVKTLYQWRYKGVGPPGLRIGRHVRYRPEDVEAWLHRVSELGQRGEVV